MSELSEAFERSARAALEAALSLEELGQRFHAELVASHIPPEMLSDPEFQRRVLQAMRDDPETSIGGHMIEVAAAVSEGTPGEGKENA